MELKASHSNFANRVDNLVITQLQLESGSRVVPLKTILQPPATGDSAGEINSHTKNVLYIGIAVSFCLEALKMFSSWTLPRFFRILMIEQRVKKLFRIYKTPFSEELGHQHQIFHEEPTILSNNKQKSIFTVKGERQAELALQTLN